MHLFDQPGKHNTGQTIVIALATAQKLSCPIVTASSRGYTGVSLIEAAEREKLVQKMLVVSYAAGFGGNGQITMPKEIEQQFADKGVPLIRAAHALSAGERALSTASGGIYPLEVAAKTLRMFGQGVKVCVEIATMAMDTGLLEYGQPVVAIGGTGHGADTAIVLTPSYSASLFDAKIHEILCKPKLAA